MICSIKGKTLASRRPSGSAQAHLRGGALLCWMVMWTPFFLGLQNSAAAAAMALGSPKPDIAAAILEVPAQLQCAPEEKAAGIQFDVLFDPNVFSFAEALPGEMARNAEKNVMAVTVQPGRVRVIVAGFNMNLFGSGIVALLRWHSATGQEAAPGSIRLAEVRISDQFGQPMQTPATEGDALPGPRSGVVPHPGAAWPLVAALMLLVCAVLAAFFLANALSGRKRKSRK